MRLSWCGVLADRAVLSGRLGEKQLRLQCLLTKKQPAVHFKHSTHNIILLLEVVRLKKSF